MNGAVTPRGALIAVWTGYFGFMPHYGIEVEAMLCQGGAAAVFGSAWGGLDASDATKLAWRRPCAWRAFVTDDRIKLWQVYVDTKAVFDLL